MDAQRLEAVLRDAREGMYAGMVDDREALGFAIEHGLVERFYESTAGFLGLAKIRLVEQPPKFLSAYTDSFAA